jgi:hypothetical protein
MKLPRLAGALAGVGGLAAAGLALMWSGRGALAPPPLAHPGRWPAWLEERGPAVAAFSLLRLVAVAALCYLVAVTVAGLVLRLTGAARMAAVADRVTVAPVRRLLAGVSLSLAAAVAGPVALVPAALASQPVSTTSTTPPATVTMHLLGPGEVPAALPSVTETPPAVIAPASLTTDRWTVKPGECFWTIAESVLHRAWGRPPSEAEIVPYWQRLIAANRSALAHPGDPDLIFPGQVFDVPTP